MVRRVLSVLDLEGDVFALRCAEGEAAEQGGGREQRRGIVDDRHDAHAVEERCAGKDVRRRRAIVEPGGDGAADTAVEGPDGGPLSAPEQEGLLPANRLAPGDQGVAPRFGRGEAEAAGDAEEEHAQHRDCDSVAHRPNPEVGLVGGRCLEQRRGQLASPEGGGNNDGVFLLACGVCQLQKKRDRRCGGVALEGQRSRGFGDFVEACRVKPGCLTHRFGATTEPSRQQQAGHPHALAGLGERARRDGIGAREGAEQLVRRLFRRGRNLRDECRHPFIGRRRFVKAERFGGGGPLAPFGSRECECKEHDRNTSVRIIDAVGQFPAAVHPPGDHRWFGRRAQPSDEIFDQVTALFVAVRDHRGGGAEHRVGEQRQDPRR